MDTVKKRGSSCRGNIHVSFEVQVAIIKSPIFEGRAKE